MTPHMGAYAPLFPRKEVLMFSRISRAVAACVTVSSALALSSGASLAANPKVVVKLKAGEAVIELYPEVAPKHVERFLKLTGEGFYNGIKFHRVIDGFMAQTGDPTGTGSGGSKYPDLPAEFSKTPFKRGTLGAARTADPNSANSQFFICYHRRRLRASFRAVHRVRPGGLRHGSYRCPQEGRRGGRRHGDRSRPDDGGEDRAVELVWRRALA